MIDSVHSVLGEYAEWRSRLHIQRPQVPILDSETKQEIEMITSDVPDLITVHGSLQRSQTTSPDALLSVRFQRGPPFKGYPSFTWQVDGEKGAIRVISPHGTALNALVDYSAVTIQVHHFSSDNVEDVAFAWDPSVAGLPIQARNIAGLYEAFALNHGDEYASFADAVSRHQEVDDVLAIFARTS